MVFALAILEFNVQAILDPHVHLDAAVGLGRDPVRVDPDVLLAHDVGHAPGYRTADEVAEFAVDPVVGFVLLLHVLEVEGVGLWVLEVPRGGELGVEGEEFVVGAAVEEHFWEGEGRVSKERVWWDHWSLHGGWTLRGSGGKASWGLWMVMLKLQRGQDALSPIVPMNCTLIPVCSNLLPSFGRIVTPPLTDSPSKYSGAFSRLFFSSFRSIICRSSVSSRTISMSSGVEKKYDMVAQRR